MPLPLKKLQIYDSWSLTLCLHFLGSEPKICSLIQSAGWTSQKKPTTEVTLHSVIASQSLLCGFRALGSRFIQVSIHDFFGDMMVNNV